MIAAAVLLGVLVALLGAFVAFYLYSRTPAWRTSETRMATMRLLVIIGPMFGARFENPPPDRPAVMGEGPDPAVEDPKAPRIGQGEDSRSRS
ncbi:MAG: hypothetical protein JWL78_1104 [Chloroflexi bacterium]|nr:hypothetical protein [Chloroflexota bacterium]MEA2617124.1 hypothetical protein [Chloroflexota bacterium]